MTTSHALIILPTIAGVVAILVAIYYAIPNED